MFVTNEQLGEEIGSHYALQALKQLYAWIFGLDVIGNPIGLVSGVTEGIEAFFYEPIQVSLKNQWTATLDSILNNVICKLMILGRYNGPRGIC